jgi:hypothetical protein
MAVTVVRGVVGHRKDSSPPGRSSESAPTPQAGATTVATRSDGSKLRSALEQAVTSNRPSKQPRTERLREPSEARRLAEDISDDIRTQGGDGDSHEGLEPIVAREHFRRQ